MAARAARQTSRAARQTSSAARQTSLSPWGGEFCPRLVMAEAAAVTALPP